MNYTTLTDVTLQPRVCPYTEHYRAMLCRAVDATICETTLTLKESEFFVGPINAQHAIIDAAYYGENLRLFPPRTKNETTVLILRMQQY